MKRFASVALMCAFLVVPSAAHADDGGWLDWLFRMDAKFVGYSTEIHLGCWNEEHKRIPCEEWYGLRPLFGLVGERDKRSPFADIRQEFNLRFSYYRTYGDLYPASAGSSELPSKTSNAIKLMGFYHRRLASQLSVGAGAGVMPFYGDDMASTQWSGVVTGAVTVAFAPPHRRKASPFFVRIEESYITHAIVPGMFTTPASGSAKGEWNFSFGIGVDARRR